ncbi:MAG TPA: branched-chain amino acid ABC transporter permease [Xanthobacteraceae bacterium]|jgi:branched-chain amino acid transport system permease protein
MTAGAGAEALQLIFAGLGNGAIYALVAIGFNVVFKSTGALNFTQGEWVMLGGMIAAAAISGYGLVWAGCLIAVVIVAAIGLVSERLVIAPLKRPTPMLITLLSIGLAIFTKSAVMLTLGKNPAGYPGFSGDLIFNVFGARVPAQTVWIIAIALVFMLAAHAFYEWTLLGKSLRAVAADREAASLVGINVRQSVMWSFVIGALAGGIAGTIITPLTFTSYDQGALIGFKGFSAAMLGGIGSLSGAMLGGIVLGLLESLAAGYVSSHFKDAVAFIVLLLILFVMPSGLLGRPSVERA